ncbi:MAG TPA: SprT-like domain-containing protein [Fimbriimonadaceae bacterium]|mgnify:CR=1 FL=1|nr:SprT-like domain-containing protein [Fimbriimonadaceae bacterium]HRJ32593.1 SprT-like domain-containing protein [Fimbriimonadaceae bacterium]
MSFDPVASALALLAHLEAEFPLKREVRLEWRRYRTTAGMADVVGYRIMLSQLLMTDADRLESTLRHEFAHLLACDRHGLRARGHGRAWQQAMRDLGQKPEVTHRYPVQRNQPRQQVRLRCQLCHAEFARSRKLPRRRRYLHVGCGGVIEMIDVAPVRPESAES